MKIRKNEDYYKNEETFFTLNGICFVPNWYISKSFLIFDHLPASRTFFQISLIPGLFPYMSR